MLTHEEYKSRVLKSVKSYKLNLPVAFWEDIGDYWFTSIFPVKHEEYGCEGLQRLGPFHAVADFAGCYYRWQRMVDRDYSLESPALMNAVVDAFGYSVILRILTRQAPNWKTVDKFKNPKIDIDNILGFYWEDLVPINKAAITMATRCAINMYRRSPGA